MRHARRTVRVDAADLSATLSTLGTYPQDPTHRWLRRGFVRAVLTPEGSGTIHLDWAAPGRVDVHAVGDGADWLADRAPAWVGATDDLTGFDPDLHPAVARWWRDHSRFRLCRSGVVWQELALVILGQRVTTKSAVTSWARLCRGWGERAPGEWDLLLPPTPARVAEIDLPSFHSIEVERRRATALRLAAQRANRLEEAAAMSVPDALRRLTALPGLGLWTATSVITMSHGDPDTVILRDHGLPTKVHHAFTGDAAYVEPGAQGDELMLRHLEPWRGHRQRVVRLLFAAGVTRPRRAAKRADPDIRRL